MGMMECFIERLVNGGRQARYLCIVLVDCVSDIEHNQHDARISDCSDEFPTWPQSKSLYASPTYWQCRHWFSSL